MVVRLVANSLVEVAEPFTTFVAYSFVVVAFVVVAFVATRFWNIPVVY